jgi:hypothetical protein
VAPPASPGCKVQHGGEGVRVTDGIMNSLLITRKSYIRSDWINMVAWLRGLSPATIDMSVFLTYLK